MLCNGGYIYVGISLNVEKRLYEHSIGVGANFTKKHKPIKVLKMYPICYERKEAYIEENRATKAYRAIYGADNVVGGKLFKLKKAK